MSLNQLTANYTDSEGEDNEFKNDKDVSISPDDEPEYKDSAKGSPASYSSGTNTGTPKKKLGRLVSYANEEEEEEDEINDIADSDEILTSEAMDTGTENGDEDKSPQVKDHGIKLPAAPPGKCSVQLQEKVSHLVSKVRTGKMNYNKTIQNKKEFRNPSIYEKLIDHLGLDEMGSNYPLELFDPHCWGKESFYNELAHVQRDEMERREKERKEKLKNDILSGAKKPVEEDSKKRKSRFDQAIPVSNSAIKSTVAPPTLTGIATTNKTTISAFGSLTKKTKAV